jgi:acyl-CoA synthetase (NDP forming)
MTEGAGRGGATRGAAAVERYMRPRSVAVIGISSKPGTAGHTVLANLTMNEYPGDIHLVGRSGGTIEGRPVLGGVDDLPEGVDLAIFTLPAVGVKEALVACARRKVRAVVIFASGFAEVGERAAQDELVKIANDAGIALLGPNCLGYTSYVDGFTAGFASAAVVPRVAISKDPAIAVLSHSGGLMGHIRQALEARNLPVSYTISSGNEAGIGLSDFIDFLAADETTRAIIVYVEQVRDPAGFLAAASRARARGKPMLMMHPGRGAKAQAAVSSHTGALAGDYDVMRVHVAHAGIALVDTLDELVDSAEILARFPNPPTKGPAVLTFSGAFCAIAHDFCEDLGLEVPPLSPATEAFLAPKLPAFAPPKNPLDLTTMPIWQPELMEIGPKALLDDPALGSLVISVTVGGPEQSVKYMNHLVAAMKGNTKPVVFSVLGDRSPLAPEFLRIGRENRVILMRSSERALRAMAQVTFHGRAMERARAAVKPQPFTGLPALGSGTQPEWLGKKLLAAAGIKIPSGSLARNVDEAVEVAKRIKFPVAMKAQAGALAHKTEAGGVLLNIADDAGVRRAWQTLMDNVARAQPGLKLDGVLVEAMAAKGLELVVGAKRDPNWGPIVLVGLGGIWVEALGDVRLMPPDLTEAAIVEELQKLRTAKLLNGFRGAPPVDVEAVAHTAALVGRLMMTNPEIMEIDINPLFAHPRGEGVTALDALIVTR